MRVNKFIIALKRFVRFLLNNAFLPVCSYVRDNRGKTLFKIFDENRELIELREVPRLLIDTLVLIEDKRFYSHHGIDFIAITRAILTNIKKGAFVQGGSTITQQLVRNVFLTKRKHLIRKLTECLLAFVYEVKRSKKQILEDYLNTIFFGESIFGIKNAAKILFSKRVRHLRTEEIALLVGMIKSPNYYSPIRFPYRAEERKKFILWKMKQAKLIDEREYNRAYTKTIEVFSSAGRCNMAPYVRDYIKDLLQKDFKAYFPQRKLIVESSIDRDIQECIEETLKDFDLSLEGKVSMCVLETKTGKIKAMAGGANYNTLKFNSAANGVLQPGSTLKPFIYAQALSEGFSPDDKFESRQLKVRLDGGRTWKVRNWQDSYHGYMSLRDALVCSDNSIFAQLIQQIDLNQLCNLLNSVGIHIKNPTLSLATGAMQGGVSPLSLAAAFSPFANDGLYYRPRIITRVFTENRELVYEFKKAPIRVIDENIAHIVNDALRDVIVHGTGYHPDLVTFAGKTGTTTTGSMLCIYDDQLLASVWVGFDPQKFRSAQEYYEKGIGPKNLFSRMLRKMSVRGLFKTPDISVF
jgi:penicillin-binding protein 1A